MYVEVNNEDEKEVLQTLLKQYRTMVKELNQWPQKGDKYYTIDQTGQIKQYIYEQNSTDESLQAFGNMFETKKEAAFKLEQLKVLHELEQLADDDQPWDGNSDHKHYTINYVRLESCIEIESWIARQNSPGICYFKTYKSAQEAINKIGEDRLKKYYFGVED